MHRLIHGARPRSPHLCLSGLVLFCGGALVDGGFNCTGKRSKRISRRCPDLTRDTHNDLV